MPKDFSAAAAHFRAAAEKGYIPAEAVLGVHYAKGLGVAQNWTEAVRWFRNGAVGGHAGAVVNLGSVTKMAMAYPGIARRRQSGTGLP